jgi:hypothetical protein
VPQLADVEVGRIDQAADRIQILARTRATQATCPSCGVPSGRTHSRYQLRWLHRLPLAVSRHAAVSTVPRFQGQGRPPGQAVPGSPRQSQEGMHHDRPALAGWSYTTSPVNEARSEVIPKVEDSTDVGLWAIR